MGKRAKTRGDLVSGIFGQRFLSCGKRPAHGVGSFTQKQLSAREALARIRGGYDVQLRSGVVRRGPTTDDQEEVCFASQIDLPESELSGAWWCAERIVLTPDGFVCLWDETIALPVATMGFLGRGEIAFITARLPPSVISEAGAWRRKRTPRPQYVGLVVSYSDWTLARFITRGIRVECSSSLRRSLADNPLVAYAPFTPFELDDPRLVPRFPFELGPTAPPTVQRAGEVFDWLTDTCHRSVRPSEFMNVALLREVQKAVLETPQQLTMTDWNRGDVLPGAVDKSSAAACIGGWALVLSERVRLSRMKKAAIETRACQALGLDDRQGQRLFWLAEWPLRLTSRYRQDPVTAEDFRANARTVATRIEWFIESGGEW